MYRIGLSGNRYSGKDRISKLFRQIMIPVFNADAVLKFILHHDYKVLGQMKYCLGENLFTNGKLDFSKFQNTSVFEEVLSFVEPLILESYYKFEKKHTSAIYTIFHYSFLFERDIHKQMNKNISVFAPDNVRISRGVFASREKITTLDSLVKTEIRSTEKNQMADFVIHNYEYGDIYDSVCQIDKKIIDDYLKFKQTNKIITI